jgi:DNA polymerase
MSQMTEDEARRALLAFYRDAGVSTVEAEEPGGLMTWKAEAERPLTPPPPVLENDRASVPRPAPTGGKLSADEALAGAERAAAAAATLEELVSAIASFEGCALRESARGPVIYDGVLGADILIIGEAPGREEDRMGKPFVGRSGQLLDRMLGTIGLSRAPQDGEHPVAITNAIYWRPPGNRNPSRSEIAVCRPFMMRFIALSKPRLILLTGNVPTQALFPDAPGITRSRGQLRTLTLDDGTQAPALPIFHPAFLLRQPAQKRWAWRDLLLAKSKLNDTLP